MDSIRIKDDFFIRLKLLEILLPVIVGGTVFSLMKPEEFSSLAAIPFFAVIFLVFIDGFLGFLVVRKGIEIDRAARQIHFPRWYRRRTVNVSEIQDIKSTFKISRDKEFNTHYTYYVELYGTFGRKRLTFKSENARDRVFLAIEGLMSEKR